MHARYLILSVLMMSLAAGGQALAQNSSPGLFGDRTLGSQGSGRQRTFSGGAGGAGAGISLENAGQVTGNERFVREARQPGQFVGSDRNELQRFVGGAQAGNVNQGNRSGLENLRALIGGANQPGNQSADRQRKYRTRVSVAFSYPARRSESIKKEVSRSVARMISLGAAPDLRVTLVGRTAVLRGTVATDHQRDVCEQLARLEAGVSRVQNELVVRPPAKPPEPTAPPQ